MLPTPHALLLDFGGVIVDADESPDWGSSLARSVNEVLVAAGSAPVSTAEVVGPITAPDGAADRFWTSPAPTQRDHASYWGDKVAAGWPAPARAAVVRRAEALSRRLMEARYAAGWRLRPGLAALLAEAQQRRLPMAVVSNTRSGAAHRDFLERAGVAGRFTVQVYSDEAGVRKPNPAIARHAVEALGVDAGRCWFVGDTLTRDVLVARRAALGAAVLMRSQRSEPPPHPDVTPDAVVADPVELHALLAAHW